MPAEKFSFKGRIFFAQSPKKVQTFQFFTEKLLKMVFRAN